MFRIPNHSPVQRLPIRFLEPEHHIDSIITITWRDIARHHRLLTKHSPHIHNRNCNKNQHYSVKQYCGSRTQNFIDILGFYPRKSCMPSFPPFYMRVQSINVLTAVRSVMKFNVTVTSGSQLETHDSLTSATSFYRYESSIASWKQVTIAFNLDQCHGSWIPYLPPSLTAKKIQDDSIVYLSKLHDL